MNVSDAKDYIAQYATTVKLSEKQREEYAAEVARWESRISLARSKGAEELALQAEKEADRARAKQAALDMEIADLKGKIEHMRRQLPGLAARERTVDPDLLEQELLMAAGYLPGEEEKAAVDSSFKALEQNASADDALAALKAKMGK
jgi:phage shock protein A